MIIGLVCQDCVPCALGLLVRAGKKTWRGFGAPSFFYRAIVFFSRLVIGWDRSTGIINSLPVSWQANKAIAKTVRQKRVMETE